jgi:hypothetical protein
MSPLPIDSGYPSQLLVALRRMHVVEAPSNHFTLLQTTLGVLDIRQTSHPQLAIRMMVFDLEDIFKASSPSTFPTATSVASTFRISSFDVRNLGSWLA